MTILSVQLFVYSTFCPAEQRRFSSYLAATDWKICWLVTVSAITLSLDTGQMGTEHRLDRAAPGSYQLNKSSEPRTRTSPTAGHLHLLCMLSPTLAGRYCCAPPEVLQGLHFSVYSTCMSASGCAQECSSNIVLSKESWCKPDAAPPASLGQPKPPQLVFQQGGSTSMRPVWMGRWPPVLSHSCSMSATWTQTPFFRAQNDLKAHLLWWWKCSQLLGRRCSTCSSSCNLHISHLAEGERMTENELRSSVLQSPLGGAGLPWGSAHFLLNVKASLLPPAARFCAKALVRPPLPSPPPPPPPFPVSRRQQRPEGPKGGGGLSYCYRYFLTQRETRSRLQFLLSTSC